MGFYTFSNRHIDSLAIAASPSGTLRRYVIGLCCSFFAKLLLSQLYFSVRYTVKFLQVLTGPDASSVNSCRRIKVSSFHAWAV
jgi:hypothetical protein